ncbi:Mannose/glucose-specific lectin [Morella rubra]|uniref:Mannose/glucose-specific lectin n=1 Tax=Morella rubra TaxID=262757 RepID=A0A6A1V934_9ROSI|nr:Mannose/glucose-specific lectin [Morella rubra]
MEAMSKVSIDCPYEYLVSFGGRYGPYDRIVTTVKYLMLETNVRSYSFGYLHEDDTYFSIPVKSGEFVGFHRRCSRLLDSIGLHLTPCSTTPAEASGSTAIARVQFDLPREFVVGLRRSYGKLGASGPVVVKYLVIQTNLRTHEPFSSLNQNDRKEVEFTTPMVTSGRFVRFHGRCGLDLDSIGLLVMA